MFVLMLGLQLLEAQSGKGGNTGVTITPGTGATSASSMSSISTPNVLVAGNVVTAEGSPPPDRVAIQRVCGSDSVRLGYSDSKGFFHLQLVANLPALQDASDSTRDTFVASAATTPSSGVAVQSMTLPPGLAEGMAAAGGCELRGVLAGFQSTSVMVILTGSPQILNVGTIVLLSAQEQGSTVSATSMKAPKKARKAFNNANAHLRKQKLQDAQAELEEAVKLYPQYATAWTKLGWLYAQQDRLDQAGDAFHHSQAADDKFVPAYMGLATVAVRQSNWPDAEKFSARATELDGVDFPLGFYYNGLANLELGQLDNAEKSTRMAERMDVRHWLPQAKLLLSEILAKKQDYAGAAEELRLYLKVVPATVNREKLGQQIEELEKLSASGGQRSEQTAPALVPVVSAPPAGTSARASVAPAVPTQVQLETNREELVKAATAQEASVPDNWAPPDVDEQMPPVRPGVPCSVNEVLAAAGLRVKQLMDSLQQFSATERVEHVSVDKKGGSRGIESANFKYVAQIREVKPGQFDIQEYRNGSPSFPANMSTQGMAAHALLLYPGVIDDLSVTCEGLGSVEGKPAWQLHFVQRPDKPPRFRQFRTAKGWFNVGMKGRAWIAADSYQVMRMETDLAKPIPEIALRKDHVIIDYGAVAFPKRNVQLWLPETTDLYIDLNGQRSHRRHSFSNFELFWVDLNEKTKDPVSPGG